jgi:hypothetical protein
MSFVGKYVRTAHENFDEFLTAVEVNEVWRKQALQSTPIMEVKMIPLMNKWLND